MATILIKQVFMGIFIQLPLPQESTVVILNSFDITTLLCVRNELISRYLSRIDIAVTNGNFKQEIFPSESLAAVRFESVEDCTEWEAIMAVANRCMDRSQMYIHATLRAVYMLMRAHDPLLKTIIGKRIIIPMKHGHSRGAGEGIIVFTPTSTVVPQWQLDKKLRNVMNGANAVIPVVTSAK